MSNEIYALPVPSSGMDGPQFHKRLGRTCEIICEYEKPETAETAHLSLIFNNCWAVKFTYYVANDASIIPLTYDKVVDFGETDWLRGIKLNIAANHVDIGHLHHIGIFFDDGPLYEFVCESFHTRERQVN